MFILMATGHKKTDIPRREVCFKIGRAYALST